MWFSELNWTLFGLSWTPNWDGKHHLFVNYRQCLQIRASSARANFSFHLCVSHSWIGSDAWICKTCSASQEAWITWHPQTNWKNQSVIVNILHRLEGSIILLATATFIIRPWAEVIFKDRWISMSWPGLWVWGEMGWGCGQIRVVSSISNLFSAQQRWTGAREETFGLQNHIITLYCNSNLHTLYPAGRTERPGSDLHLWELFNLTQSTLFSSCGTRTFLPRLKTRKISFGWTLKRSDPCLLKSRQRIPPRWSLHWRFRIYFVTGTV